MIPDILINIAKMGRSSVDWFVRFKLHMIINDKGEIIAVKIINGNVDDIIAFEAMVIKKVSNVIWH
ncbi:transposase [Rickettsia akari]|nr:transposase [Rickettsia akari]